MLRFPWSIVCDPIDQFADFGPWFFSCPAQLSVRWQKLSFPRQDVKISEAVREGTHEDGHAEARRDIQTAGA